MNEANTNILLAVAPSWSDQFEAWLAGEYRGARRRRPSLSTIKTYTQGVRVFASWWQATNNDAFSPEKLTTYDLLAFRQWSLEKQKCAPATWNTRRAALGVFAAWVQARFGLDYDLMDGIDPKEAQDAAPSWLDDEEYGRLQRALERRMKAAVTVFERDCAVRDWAMLALMVHAGCRVGDVAALDIDDVVIGERSGKLFIRNGKGEKAAEIPLGMGARRALSLWIQIRGQQPGAMFGGKRSERLTTRSVERAAVEVYRLAGITDHTAHDLKHTFLKRTLDGKNSRDGQPVPINQVRILGRHARIETTLRYVEPGWDELQSAVEVM